MKLKLVTITGPDESVRPGEVAQLLTDYPYFECGILLRERSPKYGMALFPQLQWIREFIQLKPKDALLSLHLCEEPARAFLNSDQTVYDELGGLFNNFQRIQLNHRNKVSDEALKPRAEKLAKTLQARGMDQEIIIPVMAENLNHARSLRAANVKMSVLFDDSEGAGLLPSGWSKPLDKMPCGYAGGLSPDNIAEQLRKINAVTPSEYVTWVDMEGRIRTPDRQKFIMAKAESCLKQAAPYIGGR